MAVVKGAAVHVWAPVSFGCLVCSALTLKSGAARSHGGCGVTIFFFFKLSGFIRENQSYRGLKNWY